MASSRGISGGAAGLVRPGEKGELLYGLWGMEYEYPQESSPVCSD